MQYKKKSCKKANIPDDSPLVQSIINANYLPTTDPNGSYTGKPKNINEVPVQDQDDL